MADDFTTTITTETFTFELDDAALAAPVADAIAADVAAGIAAITERSRDGKHRLFNRTGALVAGIRAVQSGPAEYSIVPPADHFQGSNADELLEKLVSLVPALQDPLSGPRAQAAIAKSLDDAMKPGPTTVERF